MRRVCLQSASTYSAVVLLPQQLLRLLLNFVLLSPIVSGGVQSKLPGQTPLHHKPLFAARGSVGVRTPPRGSDRVRSTGYECQFSTKIPAGFCFTMSYGKKSPFSRTAAHIFVSPGDAPAIITQYVAWMDGKTIQCLPNSSQHVPIYLQQFPSYTMLKSMRKSKNRYFHVPPPNFFKF